MGFKTWLGSGVMLFASVVLVGCNDPQKNKSVVSQPAPTSLSNNKPAVGFPTGPGGMGTQPLATNNNLNSNPGGFGAAPNNGVRPQQVGNGSYPNYGAPGGSFQPVGGPGNPGTYNPGMPSPGMSNPGTPNPAFPNNSVNMTAPQNVPGTFPGGPVLPGGGLPSSPASPGFSGGGNPPMPAFPNNFGPAPGR